MEKGFFKYLLYGILTTIILNVLFSAGIITPDVKDTIFEWALIAFFTLISLLVFLKTIQWYKEMLR